MDHMATQKQIDHIKEYTPKFVDDHGTADVDGYFLDYRHIENLYERVCSDLGIEPIHSNADLKLFECRILWEDGRKGISRFTLLHTDKDAVEKTVFERLDELNYSTDNISKIRTYELPGPFKAGDFVHQELRYTTPSEFSTEDF